MSKEETAVTGGLLSKVVRFVRNPTVDWGELDSIPDGKVSPYSKQMLKEMMERKRNNDFVRRREFDQLRKLRQRQMQPGARADDLTVRTTFFQSSVISPDERADERAVTLKKINEIEEQMSQQWWKVKPDPGADAVPDRAYAPTDQAGLADMQADASAHAPTTPIGLAYEPTDQAGLQAGPAPHSLPAGDNRRYVEGWDAVDVPGSAADPVGMSFRPATPTVSPAPAPEAEEFVHEPDLEEAAIRFANGDHAGAETGLLEVLAQRRQDAPGGQQLDVWMTLFDLYRAIGQHDRFDSLSIDFAACYNRSAPLWFSMPEQLGMLVEPPPSATHTDLPALPMRRDFSWNAPATLTLTSLAALQSSLARASAPWSLSWSRLTAIDEAAVPLLADHLTRWADRAGQFVFSGVEKLNTLLAAKTRSGERSGSPEWWRLRMAALRLRGQSDEFELVALDYCVTYEMSPPSWVPPHCGYSDDEGVTSGVSLLADDDSAGHVRDSGFPASDLDGPLSVSAASDTDPVAQLCGHVDGDATQLLAPFEELLRPGVPFPIACDKLIRVDFAAAGSVLNWAAEQQGNGHIVRFQNLQRLVAIFFNVIGINEHAWVVPRKD